MQNKNPKLKTNLIAETLLELKFNPIPNFNLRIGELFLSLKDIYPETIELQPIDMPIDPMFNGVPLYRFTSKDGKHLINLGRGVFSINTLDYESFTTFFKDIKEILPKFIKVSKIDEITQIALRYINKVDLNGKDVSDYFTLNYKVPDILGKSLKGFTHRTVSELDNGKLLLNFGTSDPVKVDPVILDIQFYNDNMMKLKLDDTFKWIESGHQTIYESFMECITKDFYNSLLNE